MTLSPKAGNNSLPPQDNWVIFAVLFVALVFRLHGLGFLIPDFIYSDEKALVEIPLGMIQTHDFNPHFFKYASFSYYWTAAVYYLVLGVAWLFHGSGSSFSYFLSGFNPDGSNFLLFYAGRLLSVGFGLGTIYLTYLIGKNLFSRRAALGAAFLLAISPIHVLFSQMCKLDISLLFWILLSFYFSLKIIQEGRLKNYIWAAVFGGLSLSTKYNFIIFVPLLVAVVISGGGREILRPRFLLALYLGGMAFFLTCPFCFLDFGTLWKDLTEEMWMHGNLRLVEAVDSGPLIFNRYILQFLVVLPLNAGPFIYLAFIPGAIGYLRRDWKKASFFLSFLVIYFVFIAMVSRNIPMAHYHLICFPFIFLLAADLFERMLNYRRKAVRVLGGILVGLSVLISLGDPATSYSHYYFKFYEQVGDWVSANIPPGKVAVNFFGVSPAGRLGFLSPYHIRTFDPVSIEKVEKLNPDYFIIESGYYTVGQKRGQKLFEVMSSNPREKYVEIKRFTLPEWIIKINSLFKVDPISVVVYQKSNRGK